LLALIVVWGKAEVAMLVRQLLAAWPIMNPLELVLKVSLSIPLLYGLHGFVLCLIASLLTMIVFWGEAEVVTVVCKLLAAWPVLKPQVLVLNVRLIIFTFFTLFYMFYVSFACQLARCVLRQAEVVTLVRRLLRHGRW
jgi:hypothetical protein